jgi:hypothetical protein
MTTVYSLLNFKSLLDKLDYCAPWRKHYYFRWFFLLSFWHLPSEGQKQFWLGRIADQLVSVALRLIVVTEKNVYAHVVAYYAAVFLIRRRHRCHVPLTVNMNADALNKVVLGVRHLIPPTLNPTVVVTLVVSPIPVVEECVFWQFRLLLLTLAAGVRRLSVVNGLNSSMP